MCVSLCTTVIHNTAQETVLIIFRILLQTIIIAQVMSTGREGGRLSEKSDTLLMLQHHES